MGSHSGFNFISSSSSGSVFEWDLTSSSSSGSDPGSHADSDSGSSSGFSSDTSSCAS